MDIIFDQNLAENAQIEEENHEDIRALKFS